MSEPVSYKISITWSLLLTIVFQIRLIICVFALCCGTPPLKPPYTCSLYCIHVVCVFFIETGNKKKKNSLLLEIYNLKRKKVIFLSYPRCFNIIFRSFLNCHAGKISLDKFSLFICLFICLFYVKS